MEENEANGNEYAIKKRIRRGRSSFFFLEADGGVEVVCRGVEAETTSFVSVSGNDEGDVVDFEIAAAAGGGDVEGFECDVGLASAIIDFGQGDAQGHGTVGAEVAEGDGSGDDLTETAETDGADVFADEVAAAVHAEFFRGGNLVGTAASAGLSGSVGLGGGFCRAGQGLGFGGLCHIAVLAATAGLVVLRSSVHKIALSLMVFYFRCQYSLWEKGFLVTGYCKICRDSA